MRTTPSTGASAKSPAGIAGLALLAVLGVHPLAGAAGDVDEAFGAALVRGAVADAVGLLAAGADPNIRLGHGKTALMAAAKAGAVELASGLIQRGADVNATNDNGGTALMFAAIPGHVETMTLLVDHGADVNAFAHFHWTALMVAASKGHGEGVRLLLRSGADPNVQDTYGWTPLMRAVYGNKHDAVAALLEDERLDLEVRDERGATALHVAVERGRPAPVARLLARGADPRSIDDAGRYLGIFNVKEGRERRGWNDIMSLPRHYWLAGDDTLRMAPVPELETLRFDEVHAPPQEIAANSEQLLEGVSGQAIGFCLHGG